MSRLVVICALGTLITLVDSTKTNEGVTKTTMDGGTTMAPITTKTDFEMPWDSKSTSDGDKSKDNQSDGIDLMSVMTMCNESFRIEMSYLQSLNESGSFPDETDQTPKCYLRCVLQSMHVASVEDGTIDAERAAIVFAGTRSGEPMGDITEIASYCAKHRDEKNKCEMAYNFLKCLFSMEIEKYDKGN